MILALLIFLLVVAILGSAIWELAALAVSRASGSKLRELRRQASEKDLPRIALARLILTKADRYYAALHAASFLSVVIGVYATILLNRELLDSLAALTNGQADATGGYVICTLVTLIVCVAALFAQQVAKIIAIASPESSLLRFALSVVFVDRLVSPLTAGIVLAVRYVVAVMAPQYKVRGELSVSAEDLSSIVEKSALTSGLEDEQREIIQSVFGLSDTRVREVMTPRGSVVGIPLEATLSQVTEIFEREGFSRVLVYGRDISDVKGVVLLKDLISFIGQDPSTFNVAKVLRPAFFVPNSKKVDELLDEFRRAAVHFAVVLDEHGNVDGVVTLEDILEELVGEIDDEHDLPEEAAQIRKARSGDLIVSGGVTISDLNERTGLGVPEGEYDTIAGFVLARLGRVPHVGEIIELDGVKLRVEGLVKKRITLLRLIRPKINSLTKVASPETRTTSNASNIIEGRKVPRAVALS